MGWLITYLGLGSRFIFFSFFLFSRLIALLTTDKKTNTVQTHWTRLEFESRIKDFQTCQICWHAAAGKWKWCTSDRTVLPKNLGFQLGGYECDTSAQDTDKECFWRCQTGWKNVLSSFFLHFFITCSTQSHILAPMRPHIFTSQTIILSAHDWLYLLVSFDIKMTTWFCDLAAATGNNRPKGSCRKVTDEREDAALAHGSHLNILARIHSMLTKRDCLSFWMSCSCKNWKSEHS